VDNRVNGPHFTFVPTPLLQSMNSTSDARWVVLAPSRMQRAATIVVALAALLVLVVVALTEDSLIPPLAASLLVLLLAVGLAWEWRGQSRFMPRRVVALYLVEIDAPVRGDPPRLGMRLRFADAREDDGVVLAPAFVTPWLSTIRYRLNGDARWRRWWPRVLPLWRDALPRDAFRQIRVQLKWKPHR
jgi:hypothetical protein